MLDAAEKDGVRKGGGEDIIQADGECLGGFRNGGANAHRSIGEAGDHDGHQRRRRHEAQGCGMGKIKILWVRQWRRTVPSPWCGMHCPGDGEGRGLRTSNY